MSQNIKVTVRLWCRVATVLRRFRRAPQKHLFVGAQKTGSGHAESARTFAITIAVAVSVLVLVDADDADDDADETDMEL